MVITWLAPVWISSVVRSGRSASRRFVSPSVLCRFARFLRSASLRFVSLRFLFGRFARFDSCCSWRVAPFRVARVASFVSVLFLATQCAGVGIRFWLKVFLFQDSAG